MPGLVGAIGSAAVAAGLSATPLVDVPGGTYRPLYPADPTRPTVDVHAFRIEDHPVTVGQYRAFVSTHPAWAKGAPPALFADGGYLRTWPSTERAAADDDRPITEVSWFAARAYCEAVDRRLPTEDEWELVARASTTQRDASEDDVWLASILAWYGRPSTDPLPAVLQGPANAWGVHDLTGLVWEWVEDFNNALVSADARASGDGEELRFCGVGAIAASDVRDYASFMRIAWRSALEGSTTTKNLGFRCAADAVQR